MARRMMAMTMGIWGVLLSLTASGQETPLKPPATTSPTQNDDKPGSGNKPATTSERDLAQLEARLEKLQTEVAQLTKTVAELKQHLSVLGQGLSAVDKSLDELKKDVAAVNTVLQQQMMAKRLDELHKEVAQLRDSLKQEMERLHLAIARATSPEVRKAFSPPMAMGQIILRNDWSLPVTITVDGGTYTLSPGEEQRIYRTAGTFSYEVHGWQPLRTRTLAAGEQFLIRISFP
ncbi:MAG: hypothetical protein NZM42_09895 [Gemmatales bacterium]|nr:hypothetical protein [Gemmatales bacterium]MDW8221577.1 hypothetical protein [Gemmatales bacterium]